MADWPQPSNIWTCMCGGFLQCAAVDYFCPISDILLHTLFSFSSFLLEQNKNALLWHNAVSLSFIQNLFVFHREWRSHLMAFKTCCCVGLLFHFILWIFSSCFCPQMVQGDSCLVEFQWLWECFFACIPLSSAIDLQKTGHVKHVTCMFFFLSNKRKASTRWILYSRKAKLSIT